MTTGRLLKPCGFSFHEPGSSCASPLVVDKVASSVAHGVVIGKVVVKSERLSSIHPCECVLVHDHSTNLVQAVIYTPASQPSPVRHLADALQKTMMYMRKVMGIMLRTPSRKQSFRGSAIAHDYLAYLADMQEYKEAFSVCQVRSILVVARASLYACRRSLDIFLQARIVRCYNTETLTTDIVKMRFM